MRFAEIPGHNSLKNKLINMVETKQLAHAQLFHENDGNVALALILAFIQRLNCLNPVDGDSCDTCSSCHKMKKYIHPDVHFSFPIVGPPTAVTCEMKLKEWQEMLKNSPFGDMEDWNDYLDSGNKQALINVHEAGSIRKYLSLKPLESEYRIVLIWHAERMNNQAANKLLKSIEEPPENTFFFLHTTSLDQMLGTILSRTQLVSVKPIPLEELQSFYAHLDADELRSKYSLAQGKISRLEKQIKHSGDSEEVQKNFAAWMRKCFQADVSYLIDWSDNIARTKNREEQKQFLAFCLSIFREALLRNFNAHEGKGLISTSDFNIEKFAPFIHHENVQEIYELFNESYYYIERNASSKIIFFELSLKLTKLLRVKVQ